LKSADSIPQPFWRAPTRGACSILVVAKVFGGQRTINVPSWSPDSLKVAFVSYQLLPAEEAAAK
jgi:hypothetical protein